MLLTIWHMATRGTQKLQTLHCKAWNLHKMLVWNQWISWPYHFCTESRCESNRADCVSPNPTFWRVPCRQGVIWLWILTFDFGCGTTFDRFLITASSTLRVHCSHGNTSCGKTHSAHKHQSKKNIMAFVFFLDWYKFTQNGLQKSSQNIGIPYQIEDNKAAPPAPPLWVLASSIW